MNLKKQREELEDSHFHPNLHFQPSLLSFVQAFGFAPGGYHEWHLRVVPERDPVALHLSECQEFDQNDLMESLHICEALMAEKQSAQEEVAIMQNKFDHLLAENKSL